MQVTSGINALPRGQKLAGMALGFSVPQVYRYVLLPMVFRLIFPILTSESLNIIKNSAVALTIGLMELTGSAYSMQAFTFQTFEALIVVTVIYMLLNRVVIILMRFIERRLVVPGFISSTANK